VKLPKVTLGDIAFQPENATTINDGVLTFSNEQVEALRKANYANARRAMVAQAQQPGLLDAAKRQARTSVENYFAIPLRIAGLPDVKVAATF
jgi:ABC-type methionine transport system ATPase subunit